MIDTKEKMKHCLKIEKDIYLLDNYAGDYIVTLYAGIWRKDFMERAGE